MSIRDEITRGVERDIDRELDKVKRKANDVVSKELYIPPPNERKRKSLWQHLKNIFGILQLLLALFFNPLTIVFNDNTAFIVTWSLEIKGNYGTGQMTVLEALEKGSGASMADLAAYNALITPITLLITIVAINFVAYMLSWLLSYLPLKRIKYTMRLLSIASLSLLFIIFYTYYAVLLSYGMLDSFNFSDINIVQTIFGSFGLVFLITGSSTRVS